MRRCEFGGIYVLVLATSVLVSLIGTAALLGQRVQRRQTATVDDAAMAERVSLSAMQLVLARLNQDSAWRTNHANNTWSARESLLEGSFRYKLRGGDVGATDPDRTLPVTLVVEAQVGVAQRTLRVLLRPAVWGTGAANLISNGGFESGTDGFFSSGAGVSVILTTETTDPPEGAAYLRVTDHVSVLPYGPRQDVSAWLENGRAYEIRVTVRSDSPQTLKIGFDPSITGAQRYQTFDAVVGTAWTTVSGEVTPTWSGNLSYARFAIYNSGSTVNYDIDDVVICPVDCYQLSPVAGTFSRGDGEFQLAGTGARATHFVDPDL